MQMNPHMLPKVRSEALKNACRFMPCTLRLASFLGESCSGQDTVCGCHIDRAGGKGMGTKVTDLAIAAGCHKCHDLLDQRVGSPGFLIAEKYPAAYTLQLLRAVMETQARWVGMGLLTAKSMEVIW